MINIQNRPDLDLTDALAAVREHFALDGTLTALNGERDRNFLLDATDGSRYVVKVSSPEESDEILAVEVDLMNHLTQVTGGFAPRVIATPGGAYVVRHEDAKGREHRVRMVEYVDGGLLANVRPRSTSLLYDLGRRLAELDSALGAYPAHPPARLDFDWALGRSGIVMERCLSLFDGDSLAQVRGVHEAWLKREPDFLGLGSQVIHGDVNDHNVLVSPVGAGPRRVTGIIDLGDSHSAPRVFDLGIAIAYAILDTQDPLMAAAAVARGFHETTPLSTDEVNVVYALARARLGASVSISAWRQHESGEVDDYLTVSERPAWDMLRRLHDIPVRLAEGVIRDACGFPASPRSPALASWLAKQKVEPVMDVPDSEAQITSLDLSVASPYLNGRDTEDTAAFTRSVFRRMEDDGAALGVGLYLEPRAFYLTEVFAGREGDPRERRTVHLGIDVFDHAGAEVRAPLGGRVKSAHDNGMGLDYGPTVILEHDAPSGPFWTLYGHLERDSISTLVAGAVVEAGGTIGRIGPFPENGGWPPHLHFQVLTDLLDFEGQFPGVALPREREVWASFCPDPNLILRLPGETTYTAPEPLLERRRRTFGDNLSLSYTEPLEIVRGVGTFLYDAMGRGYLDCVNNVAHVGHEHPHVVRAGQRQMGVLNTNTRYLHEAVLEYGERLSALLPEPLSVCFFVNSGSEANELALRMARARSGGSGVVAIESGYHGNTQKLIDVSHYKHGGAGGAGTPDGVVTVPMPDDYRGPYGREVMDRADRYAASVRTACSALKAAGHTPSAFIAESVLSCGGQIEPPAGYLQAAYRHARAAGAVCIADEVQTGFGRIGSHMWGFEAQGVVPDIVTLGKPMGNGHPIGAVVTTREIADAFANGMEFFSTFGGNPVSAAIGLAVLDVLGAGRLQEHAAVVGGTLKASLASLAMRHDVIGDVRGRGLFLGIDFVSDRSSKAPSPEIASYIADRAKELGVLLSTDGPHHNVIKIKPPMTFTQADAERLVATLDRVLGEDTVRALRKT
ncbi:MAG: aminotransferase class III-fold pyridoxal phosphate-dependent enzyme [Gemmatimonadetes bacterium]|nr:aminotransferase class III-fold pyridoxal phosphate-dependent enzyme [Gemmatimonadota bacterium]MDA1104877.1 aminotransferase class III-fold pyridoxal phosphate-dependent enzyme [Gemmatimonadota bacterium]